MFGHRQHSLVRFGRTVAIVAMAAMVPLMATGQPATPEFHPSDQATVPVEVSITCDSTNAAIHYVLDGTVPTTLSSVYSVPFHFAEYTAVRARAFDTNGIPSDTASACYLEAQPVRPTFAFTHSVTSDVPSAPLVSLDVVPDTNAVCYVVEASFSGGLVPTNITDSGVWVTNRSLIRWGPFLTTAFTNMLAYRLTGTPGTYYAEGSTSVDGMWRFATETDPIEILPEGGGWEPPVPPEQVAPPIFDPPSGSTNAPVDVTITCTTTNAGIYYTLDGLLPDELSTLYTNPVHIAEASIIRARAFFPDSIPSVARMAIYGDGQALSQLTEARDLSTNNAPAITVSLTLTPDTNAVCFAYEEQLAPGLAVTNVSGGGVYSETNRVVRWGPFIGSSPQSFAYEVSGLAGTYPVFGKWSIDGRSSEGASESLMISSTSGTNDIPVPSGRIPTPILTPPMGTNLPVSVAITCTETNAEIRYTLDGTLPTETSPLYVTELVIASETLVRARAFKAGLDASSAVFGRYVQSTALPVVEFVRIISANGTILPEITITAAPPVAVESFGVTERLPSGLTPFDIGEDGVWCETNRTLKWGPYEDGALHTMTYKVTGATGKFYLQGAGSVDGRSADIQGDDLVMVDSSSMVRVATPQISPTPDGTFPVDVGISCATAGAVIHYSIDGSIPNQDSAVYSSPIHLTTMRVVKARAYKEWMRTSLLAEVSYVEEIAPVDSVLTRTIASSGTPTPDVQLDVVPGTGVLCFGVSEQLPEGLTPVSVSDGGVFSPASRTIRWGPFLDGAVRLLTYGLGGDNGTYTLTGSGSFNGFPVATGGDEIVMVVNHPEASHSVSNNWSYSAAVALNVAPALDVLCYSVEEFLPEGIVPTNINHEGLWNAETRVIKWGPFLDRQERLFNYLPLGSHQVYDATCRVSYDGRSTLIQGDVRVAVGLRAPHNVVAVAGDAIAYVSWEGSGYEDGFNIHYWTASNRIDEVVLDVGAFVGDYYAISGLSNDVPCSIEITAYDLNDIESAASATVTATPTDSGGMMGAVSFDSGMYATTQEEAVITVWDADLNTNPSLVETVTVHVVSSSDSSGISVVLAETSMDSDHFTSAAFGGNLRFSYTASDDGSDTILVREGDPVSVSYEDVLPAGTRLDTAVFAEFDSDGDGLPDWWEREHFGGYGVSDGTTDLDLDGSDDRSEYWAGTNPKDADSCFRICEVTIVPPDKVIVRWLCVPGKIYTIQKCGDLAAGFYTLHSPIPADASGTNTYEDVFDPGAPAAFYRILVADSSDADADGLPDWWENIYLGGTGASDGTKDSDLDGSDDYSEYRAGTDPDDMDSCFRICEINILWTDDVVVRWLSEAGKIYTIQKNDDLLSGFHTMDSLISADVSGTNTYSGTVDSASSCIFYRILLDDPL